MKIPEILEKHRAYLESTYRVSNEITLKRMKTKPWESKVGGCPYLEDIKDYPLDENHKPMMFLAQINLEEMEPMEDFPTKGLLQFYIADDDYFGLDGACVVKYIENYKKDDNGLITKNPYENKYLGYTPFEHEGKMSFSQRKMLIGTSCVEFEERFYEKVSDEEWEALHDLFYAGDSRIGGYPLFVQTSPAYYDDGVADVLLLQLDIDDECGIMFGDAGNCTFLISKEDLKNLNFDQVEYQWQCC